MPRIRKQGSSGCGKQEVKLCLDSGYEPLNKEGSRYHEKNQTHMNLKKNMLLPVTIINLRIFLGKWSSYINRKLKYLETRIKKV